MNYFRRQFCIPWALVGIVLIGTIFTWGSLYGSEARELDLSTKSLAEIVSKELRDPYEFSGLASYYNKVSLYTLKGDDLRRVSENSELKLKKDDWLIFSGRFEKLAIKGGQYTVTIASKSPQVSFSDQYKGYRADMASIEQLDPILSKLSYGHLAWPFSMLARWIEDLFVWIHSITSVGWGVSIVFLAVTLKVLLLPLSLWTASLQRSVDRTKAVLTPKIVEIKSEYSGEAAHSRIVAAHRDADVSLFYTLKPMLGTLVQIPVLIAVFNVLGEMHQLQSQSFLWISDLSYPDSIASLPVEIPLLGSEISLLPFLMTVISIASSFVFNPEHVGEVESKKQKLPLYIMAAAFFLLFYPFPSAMVLYWTLNNVFHLVQQRVFSV